MSTEKEKFTLFWLDEDVNSDDNRTIQKDLRSLVRQLETFNDLSTCQQRLQSTTPDKRLVLIVSGRLGLRIVPRIHHLQQVLAIYVYCMNRESHEQWAVEYSKVKDVVNKRQALLERVQLDRTSCRKTEKMMSFNIYPTTEEFDQSTHDLRKQFTYSLVLVRLMLRLNIPPSYEEPLLALYRHESQVDSGDVDTFRVLKRTYSSEKPLWCYTRASFPYDMFHDALATSNVYGLLPCSFLIKDIYQKLRENQCQSSGLVYCRHIMTNDELKYLEKSINGFMLVKTFLRTNSNREHGEQSFNDVQEVEFCYKVLFIIYVNPQVAATKPYAMIDKVSGFIEPGAMLFMAGSIFRLRQVTQVTTHEATVEMELCDENVSGLQHAFQYMRRIQADANNEITLYDLANILAQMEKYDTAEQIYQFLVSRSSSDVSASVDLYCPLAKMCKMKHEYDKCARWYEEALRRQTRAHPRDLVEIGKLHGLISDAYLSDGKQREALDQLEAAAESYQKANLTNHPNLADIYASRGAIYKRQNDDNKALKYYQKAIDIDNRSPTIRPNAAKTHSDMGMIYYNREDYVKALEHYRQSLAIRRQIHPPPAVPLAHAIRNVGYIYYTMKNFPRALDFYREAANMFKSLPSSNQGDLKMINEKIAQMTRDDER